MLAYIIPVVIFLLITLIFYKNKDDDKINTKAIVLAFVISISVFVIIKYKDTFFNHEPMMSGNYFDQVSLS
jgi:hypothetical protein